MALSFSPEIMKAHRAQWLVWAGTELVPHTASMRGTWGYEARCSCGEFETHFGGGTRTAVQREVDNHRLDVEIGA